MREYELTAIYDLAVMEAGGAEASVQNLTTHVEARGGKVVKIDHWGRRRMAYPIGRAIDGDYIVSRVEVEPGSVTALEAAMRIDERIIRHLVVRADELPVPPPPREPRRDPNAAAPVAEASVTAVAPVAVAPVAEAPVIEAPVIEAPTVEPGEAPTATVADVETPAAAEAKADVSADDATAPNA